MLIDASSETRRGIAYNKVQVTRDESVFQDAAVRDIDALALVGDDYKHQHVTGSSNYVD